MVNEMMSDKVYAVCLNETTISVKWWGKTKDPIITERPVSLKRLKTPVCINGLTDLHCSILNQYWMLTISLLEKLMPVRDSRPAQSLLHTLSTAYYWFNLWKEEIVPTLLKICWRGCKAPKTNKQKLEKKNMLVRNRTSDHTYMSQPF